MQTLGVMWDKSFHWYETRERYIAPVAFVSGFVWDNVTLSRIDLWLDNLILLSYLAVAAFGMVLINTGAVNRARGGVWVRLADFAPLFLQFAFGGIFSGFFIFYSRSASIAASWPFLAFLAVVLLGNEIFRKHYQQLAFHASIFFVALFSYAIFALPVLLGQMGAGVFLLSGLASFIAIAFVLFVFSHTAPARFRQARVYAWGGVALVYLAFNALYFTNLIPPLPLSLKEVGVYHSIARSGETYVVQEEPQKKWLFFFSRPPEVFHRLGGEAVYAYSAVFAPTDLKTKILHRWAYYDETKTEWINTDLFSFPIVGGRDGGYRGFTLKQNITPVRWRIDVITERGQLLGRAEFMVEEVVEPPELSTKIF